MDTEHSFAREEVMPSWWANALGKALSVSAAGLQLSKLDATHLQIVAGAGVGAAVVAIQGRWRWIEATISRAHPGGGAGAYDVFVTAKETDIVSTPAPYTDATDYSFGLAVLAAGSTPTIIPGSVDIYRKIGSVQWDGAQITRIDQTVPAPTPHAHRHAAGQPDSLAPADIGAPALATANVFTAAQVIDGTLTVQQDATMQSGLTVVGPTQFGNVVSTGPISGVVGITASAFASTAVAIGALVAGKSAITFQNGEAGSSIYRSAASRLQTDGDFWARSLTTTSDARLKTKITTLDAARALETILALRGVKHSYTDEQARPGRRDYGYIAQEVHKVVPEVVGVPAKGDAQQHWGLDYMRLLPLATEAIRCLSDRVDALEAQLVRERS